MPKSVPDTCRRANGCDAGCCQAWSVRTRLSNATGSVLSSNLLQPVLFNGLERAEYTIGVAGCGKRAVYVSVCQVGSVACFAAGTSGINAATRSCRVPLHGRTRRGGRRPGVPQGASSKPPTASTEVGVRPIKVEDDPHEVRIGSRPRYTPNSWRTRKSPLQISSAAILVLGMIRAGFLDPEEIAS